MMKLSEKRLSSLETFAASGGVVVGVCVSLRTAGASVARSVNVFLDLRFLTQQSPRSPPGRCFSCEHQIQ